MARYELIGAAIPSLLRLQENVTDGLAFTAEKHFTGAISTTGEPTHIDKLSSLGEFIVIGIRLILFVSCTASIRRLHAFKGPKLAAISNWWYFRQLIGGRQHLAFHRVSQSYGMSDHNHIGERMQG